MMIFMTFFGIIMFVASILYLLGLYVPYGDVLLPGMVLGFFIVVVLPIMTYIGARRLYSSQPQINERISYTFGENGITIVGESFRSEIKWNMVYKIVEWENWVLLYQNSLTANVIPKECFGDQMPQFRELVGRRGVKAKLSRSEHK